MTAFAPRLLSRFNLRTLVMVAGLLLMFVSLRPSWVSSLDNLILDIGKKLIHLPAPTLDVRLIHLTENERKLLHQEPGRADTFTQVLAKLLKTTPKESRVVGVLLDEPLPELSWIASALGDPSNNDILKSSSELQRYATTAKKNHDLLGNSNVVMGLPQDQVVSSTENPIAIESSNAAEFYELLPPELRPVLVSVISQSKESTNKSAHSYAPVFQSSYINTHLPLLARDQSARVLPGFVLTTYQQFSKAKSITWLQYQTLLLDGISFNTSTRADIIPLYSDETIQNHLKQVSLDEALSMKMGSGIVLISELESNEEFAVVAGLLSLEHQQYLFTPYWFSVMELVCMAFALVFLCALLPRLSFAAGVLANCLLITLLLVVQLGWLIVQTQWLPLGVVVSYLLAGYLAISLWKLTLDRDTQLIAAAHGARYQLGLQLFRDGRGDDALLAIKECVTSDAVLALMYDIAAQQERKRHYSEAVKTYQAIVLRQKGFKDAEQKVEKLMAFSSGGATSLGNSSDIAQTIIISQTTINKPVLGRYEIERELGRGAMGVVYLGRDPKISRQVAIKTLSYGQIDPRQLDDFKTRFFREAEAAGRLNHPNIVTVYDVGEEHDLAFIAMDYVNGESLGAYISEDTLLPVDEVCELIAKVADALEYAHTNQIIHRDIKPGNIMYVRSNRTVKVADFGVARIVDSAKTNTGDILGSPLYMSPEQLKGEKVSYQTDIYSLGVTFYQLLTGHLPFSGENLANLTYNIIHEKYKGVREIRSELPKGLTRIVNRALQKEAAKRYMSSAELANAIRNM